MESHSWSIEIDINVINLISYVISTSVSTDIYISNNDGSVDSLDPFSSQVSFVTENPDHSFDRDNPLAEYFKFTVSPQNIWILLLLTILKKKP